MNRRLLLFGFIAGLTLAALTVYEARAIDRRRNESAAVETALRQTQQQLAALHDARERNLQDLSTARRQLDDLSVLVKPAVAAGEREREAEVQAWLGRVKQLRELFAQNPGQQIPELSLLAEADWLRASRKINLSDEDQRREALAKLRSIAKEKFSRDLASALTKFIAAHNGQLPRSLSELASLLSPAPDLAALQRYALTNPGAAAGASDKAKVAITEVAAIDADYDARVFIYSNGGFAARLGPEEWIENFPSIRLRAVEAYATANHGAVSQKLADLIPYMNPPLPPATAEKLLSAERKRTR